MSMDTGFMLYSIFGTLLGLFGIYCAIRSHHH